jgi:O-antigen ligase
MILFMKKFKIKAKIFDQLLIISLAFIVSTGLYTVWSNILYFIGIILIIKLLLIIGKRNINCEHFIYGVILVNSYIFFMITMSVRDINEEYLRLYFNYIIGPIFFIIITTYLSRIRQSFSIFLPIISVMVLLLGIYMQFSGIIQPKYLPEFSGYAVEITQRPSGFLNPNTTAAICLIWLYCFFIKDKVNLLLTLFILLMVFIVIIITQSRAALLSLSFFLIIKIIYYIKNYRQFFYIIKHFSIILFFALIFSLISVNDYDYYYDFIFKIFDRGIVDDSSLNRINNLLTVLEKWPDSIFIGHGMRALVKYTGFGAHNEIAEWIFNFGLIGLLIMLLIYFRFYHVQNYSYILLCIIPTFFFSHNFFEHTAFQVTLAFAYSETLRVKLLKEKILS